MAEQEVVIRVKQIGEGTALKDAVSDAEKLKQQGGVNPNSDVGRIFAKQDATRANAEAARVAETRAAADRAAAQVNARQTAERAIAERTAARSNARQATERAAAERAAARSIAREAAEAKLRETRGTRLARFGSNVALQAADGGISPASVLSLAGAVASGPGLLAVTAAVLSLKLLNRSIEETDKRAAAAARSIGLANRTRQAASLPGVAGADATVSNLNELEGQLKEAKGKRGTFADEGWNDSLSLWMRKISGGRLGGDTSGEKKGIANEEEIDRLEMAKRVAEKRAQDRFKDSTAASELDAQRALLSGDKRGAQAIRDKVAWEKDYQGMLNVKTQPWQAEEFANNRLALEQRKRNDFGGLLNARSGAGDITRVAELSGGNFGLRQEFGAMHQTIRQQHREALKPRLNGLLTPRIGNQMTPRIGRL